MPPSGQSTALNVERKPGFAHREVGERHSRAGRASGPVRQADDRSEGTAQRREERPTGGTTSQRQLQTLQTTRRKCQSGPVRQADDRSEGTAQAARGRPIGGTTSQLNHLAGPKLQPSSHINILSVRQQILLRLAGPDPMMPLQNRRQLRIGNLTQRRQRQ